MTCLRQRPLRRSLELSPLTAILLAATLLAFSAPAQTLKQHPADTQSPPPGATVLHASTHLVVVDVVVQDKHGQPIHGLHQSDFLVTENKEPQQIHTFEEFTAPPPGTPTPALPQLPPGTFTDYSPVTETGSINILLLDSLNTPVTEQPRVRQQLQEFVKKAHPGTRIAIFGLTTHLILLQGFTADPQVLRYAIDHNLNPRAATLPDDPSKTVADPSDLLGLPAGVSAAMEQSAANIRDFTAPIGSFETRLRVEYTLDAFHNLAVYLASFPGRKNLMWFSGAFPLNILPDASLSDPFSTMEDFEEEVRDTTNLFNRAQVAVYPIDSRGFQTNPALDATQANPNYVRNPNSLITAISQYNAQRVAEHNTMDSMAEDTGGHAFYDTNGLADAVTKAIDAGSNFYTLSYNPTNRKADGSYRDIRVHLTPEATAHGFKLTYRRGYYADDNEHPRPGIDTPAASTTETEAAHTARIYAEAAMDRGAPEPADILFKVSIRAASAETEPSILPDNQPVTSAKLTGPFRRYNLDMVTLGSYFSTALQSNGHRTGKFAFKVLVYDANGRLLNSVGRSVVMDFTPETYKTVRPKPLTMHLEVSVPTHKETYLRIALQDVPANRFGVVEVPVASLAHLSSAEEGSEPETPSQRFPHPKR
ncbi:MAG: VWA domain-containing protein [Acidobacteriota bacterium]